MLNMDKTTTEQKNPKNKKLIVGAIIGAFVLVGAGAAIFSGDETTEQTNVNAVSTTANTGKPIQSNDEKYIAEVKENNVSAASEAIATENSHIDTITNKVNESPINDGAFLNNNPNNETQQNGQVVTDPNQQQMQPQTIIQERVIYKEVAVPTVEKYDYKKDESLIALFNNTYQPRDFAITPVSNIAKREELVKQAEEKKRLEQEQNLQKKQDLQSVDGMNLTTLYKTGDLIPATLQTGIDTRRPSIVRARIESGPLAGAILTGSFEQNDTSVQITFTSLNIPNAPMSIPFEGVAMDYKNASTALATSVNRHIPLRIAMAFAGTFAKGYSDALKTNNVTSTSYNRNDIYGNNSGNVTVTTPKNSKQLNKEAAGEAINATTDIISGLVPQNPTVKVQSNMEIGIYVMSDFKIDKKYINE